MIRYVKLKLERLLTYERCFEKNSKRVDENNNTYYIEIQDQEKRCRYALEIYENRDELYYDE